MHRTQIQLTERQHERLREAAHRNGVSMSEMVRRCVERWLEEEAHVGRQGAIEQVLSLAGRYDSGLVDIAERHDEYLAEDFS